MTLIFTVNTQTRETNKKTLVGDSLLPECIELDCVISIVNTYTVEFGHLQERHCWSTQFIIYPRLLMLLLKNQFELVY